MLGESVIFSLSGQNTVLGSFFFAVLPFPLTQILPVSAEAVGAVVIIGMVKMVLVVKIMLSLSGRFDVSGHRSSPSGAPCWSFLVITNPLKPCFQPWLYFRITLGAF